MVENALSWISENTTIVIDTDKLDTVAANVRLFIVKYFDIMERSIGVTSESAGGLSQSFDTQSDLNDLLISTARAILGEDVVTAGAVTFFSAKRAWK